MNTTSACQAPAFPNTLSTVHDRPGMSLRDYFAGQALPVLLQTLDGVHYSVIAARAYKMADAMLQETVGR